MTPPRIRFEVRTVTNSVGTRIHLHVDGLYRCLLGLTPDEAEALRRLLEGHEALESGRRR